MGEKTGISWTDHTFNRVLFCVNFFMAFFANRNPIAYLVTDFWKFRKFLDVVSNKIAAAIVPALLERKTISRKHIKPPSFIKHGKALVSALRQLSVFITMAIFATGRFFSCRLTDLYSRLNAERRSPSIIWKSFVRFTKQKFCFCSVRVTFESGYSSFGRFTFFHPAAYKARSINTIGASSVLSKFNNWLPSFTPRASFQSRRGERKIILYGNSCEFCS